MDAHRGSHRTREHVMSEKTKLLGRKVAIAFGVGAGAVVVKKAAPVLDGVDELDWPTVAQAGQVLLFGAIAGGLRAVVSLLTAWVPSDGENGVNLVGKYRDR